MKKIIIAFAVLFATYGCVSEDPSFNNDQDKSYDVPAETLLSNAQKELADQSSTPDVNLNTLRFFTQYWASTQYPDESRYWITRRRIGDNMWINLYRGVLSNLTSAKEVLNENPELDEETKTNMSAIIEIQMVYAYQLLVDSFGDIPYSEANDPLQVLPAYDDDSTIYPALIERLDAALSDLDENAGTFTSGDIIYNGDVESWRRFGNSLKVKLGINLADVDAALAQSTIESAVTDGVILTNDQNALFRYSGAPPFYNQIHASLIAAGRNDYVASETIVNEMNTLSDPRRDVYFKMRDGQYVGGVNGAGNAYTSFSAPGTLFESASLPAPLMEATEVNFYLAEAAARGYSVGGTPESYYDAAITASFDYWEVGDVAGYLANPAVNYATAAGDYKQKIGMQAWIAFYARTYESWNSYRRLDYPVLQPAQNAIPAADGQVPVRITYPINEQTVNNANWTAASSAIGGDELTTKVFWDLN